MDDEEELEQAALAAATAQKKAQPWKREIVRPPYANFAQGPIRVHTDEEIQVLLQRAKEEKDARSSAFFSDPETNMKIFFSTYMRDQGLLL